jgi:hypothetical protein
VTAGFCNNRYECNNKGNVGTDERQLRVKRSINPITNANPMSSQ